MAAIESESRRNAVDEPRDPRKIENAKRIHVVINARAGTVLGLGKDALVTRIERVFADRGISPSIEVVPPNAIAPAITAPVTARPMSSSWAGETARSARARIF